MSDYEHSRYSRTYPYGTDTSGGTGAFWGLVVVVALGVLLLLMALGGAQAPITDPSSQPSVTGAEPAPLPADPDASATGAGAVVE
jgi:hypothetical protein